MQTYLDNLLASMLEENKRLATCVTTLKSLVDEAKIDCQINNTENNDNMKHSTEQKPEAHRLAEKLRDAINRIELGFSDAIATNDLSLAAMELESLHTRVQELEAKEAKPAAPVVLSEPVAAQVRFKPENDTAWSRWKVCAVEDAREIEAYTLVNGWGYEVRYLHAEQQVRELLAQAPCTKAQTTTQEPFGYFKLETSDWRWMDCAEFDEGARPLYEAPQPQADALDAERYRWLRDEWLDNEPEAINMERARGQRGLDAAIDAAIAAAKENK